MKKLILIALTAITNIAIAQKSESFIKDVSVGGLFSAVATTTPAGSQKPFATGNNLFAIVNVKTSKTFHNIFYGFGDNSINSLNGYFLKRNWDTYMVYSSNLHKRSSYLGCGIEKMEKVGGVKFFLFSEVGTNFKGSKSLSVGLLVNASWSIRR
jgi:hypothetical protein